MRKGGRRISFQQEEGCKPQTTCTVSIWPNSPPSYAYLAPAEEGAERDEVHAHRMIPGDDERSGNKPVFDLFRIHLLEQLHHVEDDGSGKADD